MNLYLFVEDEDLARRLSVLILGLAYPMVDITDHLEKADVVLADHADVAQPLLSQGKYVVLYLTRTKASKAPSVPANLKPKFRLFVVRPKNLRNEGESPALGKLLAYLVRLAEQLNIS